MLEEANLANVTLLLIQWVLGEQAPRSAAAGRAGPSTGQWLAAPASGAGRGGRAVAEAGLAAQRAGPGSGGSAMPSMRPLPRRLAAPSSGAPRASWSYSLPVAAQRPVSGLGSSE
jgi:hypothetical protein